MALPAPSTPPTPSAASASATLSTRTRLLLTAERLFAVHGIAEVSLRRISADAGQRNTAAAHYHFGDKTTLLREILRTRLAVVDRRRGELVSAACEGSAAPAGVRPLVDALVRPLAEQAAEPGSHYVRFLARLLDHLGHDPSALAELGGFDQAFATAGLVADRLPHLTEPHAGSRARWTARLLVSALADLEFDLQGHPDLDPEPAVLALTDALTGLLTAPVTGAQPR